MNLLIQNSFTPPEWCQSTTCLYSIKQETPPLIDNYRHIALVNLLELWAALIKEADSICAITRKPTASLVTNMTALASYVTGMKQLHPLLS
jgi:hypothetical protein